MARTSGTVDWVPARRAIVEAVGDRPFRVADVLPAVRQTVSATMAARWGEAVRVNQRRVNERRGAGEAGKKVAMYGDRWSRQTVQNAGIQHSTLRMLSAKVSNRQGLERVDRGLYRITDAEAFIG